MDAMDAMGSMESSKGRMRGKSTLEAEMDEETREEMDEIGATEATIATAGATATTLALISDEPATDDKR